MRYIQFSLTVNDGKWLIAEAIAQMEVVRHAAEGGSIVFKGGTTVSCVSQLMTGTKLRISGRISPRGALSAKTLAEQAPHTLLWQGGEARSLDTCMDDAILMLRPDDVLITGANIIDADGDAAMLAGSPGGNICGKAISAMASEGFTVLIAAGLEKLIPGKVRDSILQGRRQGIDTSYGMACGLFPVHGQVVTELSAITLLADVRAVILGRGGLGGAEGGTLFQVWGEPEQVDIVEKAVERSKDKPVGGNETSLIACTYPALGCKYHLSCRYRQARGV